MVADNKLASFYIEIHFCYSNSKIESPSRPVEKASRRAGASYSVADDYCHQLKKAGSLDDHCYWLQDVC